MWRVRKESEDGWKFKCYERHVFEPVVLTPGHGEPQSLLAFIVTPNLNSTVIDQLKQLITWSPGFLGLNWSLILRKKQKPVDSVALHG
uniref:Uncharacterized protein n=1 Tax=Anguilla anguilla TaxID=7936 RepID=A0A0E9X7Q9_ANGAN